MPVPVIPLICLHENTDKKGAWEKTGITFIGQGVEKMQVSCVCPAQLGKLIIILGLRL